MSRNRFLFPLLILTFLASAVLAQDEQAQPQQAGQQQAVPLANGTLDQAAKDIAKIKATLSSLESNAKQSADDDQALVDLTGKIDDLNRRAAGASSALAPRLGEIGKRLTELGDPPKEGQPAEATLVTDERNRLIAERTQITAVTGDADNVTVALTRLSNQVTAERRKLFAETLLRRTDVSISVLNDAGGAFGNESRVLQNTLSSWVTFVWKFKSIPLFTAVLLSLAAALIFLLGGYRLFGVNIERYKTIEKPSYLSRLSVAFWSTLVRTLSLTAFLIVSYIVLETFNVLRPDIAPIVSSLFGVVGLIYFVGRVANGAFTPTEPNWRLVKLSNRGAHFTVWCLVAMTVVSGLDFLFGTISESLGSPVVLTVVKSFFAAIIIGVLLFSASFAKPMLARDGDPDAPGRNWPHGLAIVLRVMGIGLILLAFTGYIGLARFVASQLIITGAVIATMAIGVLTGRAVSRQEVFADTVPGRFLQSRFNLGPIALDQAGLVAGLFIYAVALVTGIPLILMSWGFHVQDLEMAAYRLFTEIKLGNITISLVGIFTGILLFTAAFLGTRWFQRWLDGNVMARSHVDLGVRNSVKTGIGYLGIGMAAIIGVSAAGIDLSSFALFASALSVGIGFGLQNIVSNFVSGLILLVERPFKVGDHIISGTSEGIVKRISVRATEIETFRKQSIIVPNSELINASVGNWTHRNKMGRSEIPVSVGYDADAQKVMDILLELVNKIPLVLRNPEPHVEFMRFGPYSLDFELRFFLGDMGDGMQIRNSLRIAILKRFKEEGINIPLPQTDIVLHRHLNAAEAPTTGGENVEVPVDTISKDLRKTEANAGTPDPSDQKTGAGAKR